MKASPLVKCDEDKSPKEGGIVLSPYKDESCEKILGKVSDKTLIAIICFIIFLSYIAVVYNINSSI